MFRNLIFICVLIGFINCSAQSDQARMPDIFYKCWTASYEEDAEAANIFETFRPCDYKEFKAGMFRQKIEFYKNGKCKWLQMAPNDAHSLIDALWIYKFGKIIVKNEKKETIIKFRIEHLAGNRMNIMVK